MADKLQEVQVELKAMATRLGELHTLVAEKGLVTPETFNDNITEDFAWIEAKKAVEKLATRIEYHAQRSSNKGG